MKRKRTSGGGQRSRFCLRTRIVSVSCSQSNVRLMGRSFFTRISDFSLKGPINSGSMVTKITMSRTLIDTFPINLYASQSCLFSVGRSRFAPTLKSVADLPKQRTPSSYLEQQPPKSWDTIRACATSLPPPFLSGPRPASFRSVHGALLLFVKRVSAAYVCVESAHTLWYDCPARGYHIGGLHGK